MSPYASVRLVQSTLSTGHVDNRKRLVGDTLLSCAWPGHHTVDNCSYLARIGLSLGKTTSTAGGRKMPTRFLLQSLDRSLSVDTRPNQCIYPQPLGKTCRRAAPPVILIRGRTAGVRMSRGEAPQGG